jgi:hypothetical protein
MSASTRTKTLVGVIAFVVTARLVDVALVSAGFATALGSVVFAGAMLMRGNHAPNVNGLEYLAIFGRPGGAVRPSVGVGVDPTPVGSIGGELSLVAAESGFAWVGDGSRVFAVRPGDSAPRLGRVGAIVHRDGRWSLLGDDGAVLLSREDPAPPADGHAPFTRQMIFGPGK